MCIESHILNPGNRYEIKVPGCLLHVSTIDNNKSIMINGIYLPDVVFDADLSSYYPDVVSLPYACTDIYTYSVILSEQVANADEQDLPVFVCQQFSKLVRHL